MRKTLLLFLLTTIAWHSTNATIRRVGYTASAQPVLGLDYGNFQAAHDAAADGDTIQLYPTAAGATYTGTIDTRLVIMGPGYLNNSFYVTGAELANFNIQNLVGFIASCDFTVNLGSAGTIFQSINGLTVRTTNRLESLPNITINRCRNVFVQFDNSSNCDSWIVSQCMGFFATQNNASGSFTGNRTITNLLVTNTVINGNITLSTSPTGTYTGNKIYNCIAISGVQFLLNNAAVAFQNCIFDGQSFTGTTNTTFVKNLTTLAASGNIITNTGSNSGNLYSQVLANVFNGYPSYTQTAGVNNQTPDNRFILKTGSTAIGAGFIPGSSTVTNCGIYGGTSPYITAGTPPIPVYNRFNAPSAVFITGQPYTITFSVTNYN
jgi:hypothetical protein